MTLYQQVVLQVPHLMISGVRVLDPLSIDPNERVTPEPDPSMSYQMPDLPDLSIAVGEIGLIPPPPMFSSSPPASSRSATTTSNRSTSATTTTTQQIEKFHPGQYFLLCLDCKLKNFLVAFCFYLFVPRCFVHFKIILFH